MARKVDLADNRWYSGDLDVRRPTKDLRAIALAEDLHVVPLTTWWNDHNEWAHKLVPEEVLVQLDRSRFGHLMAGEQVWPGGSLFYFNLPRPGKLPGPDAEYPPIARSIASAAKQNGVWVDVSKAYAWDLPMLVALGQVDSIQVLNRQIGRGGMVASEEGGKPRDRKLYPSANGTLLWSQDIYHRLLECGLRIPPSAGSGAGVVASPAGFNRVYVHVDGDFTYEKWWESFRAGRVTITNGPLMQPSVRGKPPGYVFQGEKGRPLEFEIGLTLSLREPITYLEILKNGRVEHEVRFDQFLKDKGGKLPKVRFDDSGWFLLRAVIDEKKNYRFAMTAPYFVEMGYQRRISKRSAQFFLDWCLERAKQIHLDDPEQQRAVLDYHRKARDFWQDLVNKSNAE
jgi:hypothetical protein